ncbi:MAG TPA: hypothetical protein VKK79_20090 [Candidatus Lokiarchaeia archaeon]|nr:hypothetical protein [Candidatus Lokiarchaeia archaeon]
MDRLEWIFFGLKYLTVGGSESGARSFRTSLDEYTVNFLAGKDQPGILCEVTSSATLPPALALKPDQEAALRDLGFADPGENPHFTRQVDAADEATLREMAATTIKVLREIYGCEGNCPLELSFYLETGRLARTLQYLVVSFLTEFLAEHGPENLLLVESGRIYAQFTPRGSNDSLYCEVVSNKYLPPDLQLSSEKIDLLTSRGFNTPAEEGGNFQKVYPAGDSKAILEIAKDVLGTFQEAYGLASMPKFKLTLTID